MAFNYVYLLTLWTAVSGSINNDCPLHLEKNNHLAQFGESCYEFIFHSHDDWYAAQADCRSKQGHLVDIHSYAEHAFIFNQIQVLGVVDDTGVWIGLSDEDGEGHWKWTTGNEVTFSNWEEGQPGMIGGFEDCALMEFKDTGLWHDYSCDGLIFSENHGWICEYPLV